VTITAQGMINGKRNKNDGYTLFGVEFKDQIGKEDNITNVNENSIMFDYTFYINKSDKESALSGRFPVALFKFDLNSLKYQLKDLYSGMGVFMKVKNETLLKHNSLINVGDSYIIINFPTEDDSPLDKVDMINIKVFNKNNQLTHDPMYVLSTYICIYNIKLETSNLPNPPLKSGGQPKMKYK
jgi:hypothetical protein